jgi:hypothetical protein
MAKTEQPLSYKTGVHPLINMGLSQNQVPQNIQVSMKWPFGVFFLSTIFRHSPMLVMIPPRFGHSLHPTSSNIIQRFAPAPSPVMFEVEAQDLQPKRCGRCTIGFVIEADSKTPGTEKGVFVSPTRT